jgi:DNA invertase Pin-like site-specific DNA recombinase
LLAHLWGVGDRVAIFEVAAGGEILRDDPEDPSRTTMRQMAGVFAELERAMTVARLSACRRPKRERGEFAGGNTRHPKFGYRIEAGRYVPVESEQADDRAHGRPARRGQAYREVVAALDADGIAPPAGSTWFPATVSKILKSERPAAS